MQSAKETDGVEEAHELSFTKSEVSRLLLEQTVANNEEKEHKFWNTQPVVQSGDDVVIVGPLDEVKTLESLRLTPYTLVAGFEWSDIDILNDEQATEVYTLLSENYVEDDDGTFRFDYPVDFLRWALSPPGFSSNLHIGVRRSSNRKLCGFVSGIPAKISVDQRQIDMVEINFLCVHKKLRRNRLAPVLIKEVTRRTNLTNVWQAVYTAGAKLPRPASSCRYFHRSLNPKKLTDIGFSRLSARMTIGMAIKIYRVNAITSYPFRQMETRDVASVHRLLLTYLTGFRLACNFSVEEVAHFFLPRSNVNFSYVLLNNDTGEVSDLVSFYHLPSTILRHEHHKTLHGAYSYYNIATSIPLVELMKDALILAKMVHMDVFNCLDIMNNESFFKELRFGPGDGKLHYYLYNWGTSVMTPQQVGLVLM